MNEQKPEKDTSRPQAQNEGVGKRPASSDFGQKKAHMSDFGAGKVVHTGANKKDDTAAPTRQSREKKTKAELTEEQKHKKEIRRKRRRIRIATTALSLIALLLVGAYAGYTTVFDHIRGEDTQAGTLPAEISTETIPEYTGENIVAGLICGIDYDLDELGKPVEEQVGRTDLILYLMYDTENNKANILQIPRDVYVGMDLPTGGEGKINGLYYNSPDEDNRMSALADVIYDQFKLPVDFYMSLDMYAVQEMVYCLGKPLRVYVPQDIVDDPLNPQSVLEQGWRDLDKSNIEFFLRSRDYNDADIGRLAAQQYFYAALFRELQTLAPMDMVKWMTIIIYYGNIGGLGPTDIMGLGQEALALESEDILFVRPSVTGADATNSITGAPVSLVSLVPEEMAELLNEYFRPEGHVVPVEELNIQTLPVNYIGKAEASVTTIAGIEETEGEQ